MSHLNNATISRACHISLTSFLFDFGDLLNPTYAISSLYKDQEIYIKVRERSDKKIRTSLT